MGGWTEKRLGTLIDINPNSISASKYKGQIRYIDISSVNKGQLEGYTDYDISEAPGRARRIIHNDDIIYSTVRPNLKSYWYVRDCPDNAICSTGFAVLRPKACANPRFIYYLVSENGFVDWLSLVAKGSAYPAVDVKDFLKAKVRVPDKEMQTAISEILSKYDNLIENNNKRIKILEQMAEELYKEWFVRFRFPGYASVTLQPSKFGNIPKNFSLYSMSEVIEYYIGGGWGQDDESADYPTGAFVIRGTDFPKIESGNWQTCQYRFHKNSNYKSRVLAPYDIILEVSGGTQEQPVGRTLIVTPEMLENMGNTVICASFCKQIRCNREKVSPIYFYYWMQFLYDTRVIDTYQLQSTGIINFQFEYFLRKGAILIPPKPLMENFEKVIITIYKQKDTLARANDNLIKQRDMLLPRLMSGKLEVK